MRSLSEQRSVPLAQMYIVWHVAPQLSWRVSNSQEMMESTSVAKLRRVSRWSACTKRLDRHEVSTTYILAAEYSCAHGLRSSEAGSEGDKGRQNGAG